MPAEPPAGTAADDAPVRPGVTASPPDDDAATHGGVDVGEAEGVTAVRLWGEVDLAVRVGGTAALERLRGGTSPISVDCREVDFMDSTGMSILVRVLRDASDAGRTVQFLGASEPVRVLMEVTGVDRWMSALGVRPPA